jgi:hypothetical protein
MSPEEARLGLQNGGYDPVPLSGKIPVLKAWQTRRKPTQEEISLWSRTHPAATNTGVKTRSMPTLDLDILDPDAADAIEDFVRDHFGERGRILVRFGARPKRAILFRTNAPFAKIAVNFVVADGAPGQKIEFLGDGQQVVVDGVHPGTGRLYEWFGGSPLEIKHGDLPVISADEAQALVGDVARLLVEKFGYRLKPGNPPVNGPKTYSHVWRSKDHDFSCIPTGVERRDDGDGWIYAWVRTSDGTEHIVPKDELIPAQGRNGYGGDGQATDWSLTPDVLIDHDKLVALAMRLLRSGMSPGAAVNFLHTNVEGLANVNDERRQRRLKEIPGMVESAVAKVDAARHPPPPVEPTPLNQVVKIFREWLALKDDNPVHVALGTLVANLLPGDPVWLGLIAPPSSAKTELLNSVSHLSYVEVVETFSPAALLSGSPKKDRAKGATGGVLCKIGTFGVLLFKDFGSVLDLRHEQRADMMTALRRIYDGQYTRQLGTEGGRTLEWRGKAGCIFGATQAYDSHHGVAGTLGDRFLLLRVETMAGEQLAKWRLQNGDGAARMRQKLAQAVAGLFASLPNPLSEPEGMTEAEYASLSDVILRVVRLRAGVVRDGYRREIDDVHDPEGPARLSKALQQLFAGLILIGVPREEAVALVERVAYDIAPKIRLRAFSALTNDWQTTRQIAAKIKLPTITTRRALEELAAHDLAVLEDAENDDGQPAGGAHKWKRAQ